jgi:hypothetical protein
MTRRQDRHHIMARRSGGLRTVNLLMAIGALLFFQNSVCAAENDSRLDEALDKIAARGLYFRVDLSMEVFNPSDEVPTVLLNTSTPVVVPITPSTGTSSTTSGPAGSISLSDNAQSSISALVNVIGAGSVINVGVNVISITNSTSDTIYTTNTNFGVLGNVTSTSLTP